MKAYNSVLRNAIWTVLKKFGVPDTFIDIVKSFCEDMEARIQLDQGLAEVIKVNIGLRQGCSLALTLFNIYFYAVMEQWLDKVKEAKGIGVHVQFKVNKQLSKRGAYFTVGQFADHAVLFAVTQEAAEWAIKLYQRKYS